MWASLLSYEFRFKTESQCLRNCCQYFQLCGNVQKEIGITFQKSIQSIYWFAACLRIPVIFPDFEFGHDTLMRRLLTNAQQCRRQIRWCVLLEEIWNDCHPTENGIIHYLEMRFKLGKNVIQEMNMNRSTIVILLCWFDKNITSLSVFAFFLGVAP